MRIRKAATYAEIAAELDAALDQYSATSPFLIHFRIATHGEICEGNSHPFPVKGGGAMIHNGMLTIPGLPAGYSDSKYFANNVISKLPHNWYRTPHWPGYIEDMIGSGNKIVCLYPDALVVIGEKRGNWKNGVWYSNTSGHITYFRNSPAAASSYSSPGHFYNDESWDDYGDYRAGGSAYSRFKNETIKHGQAGPVKWEYSPTQTLLVPGGTSEGGEYDETWEEAVLLMEPENRRKLLRELMQTDVSDMDDDDIEDFMLSLPILHITNDQDPLELMRDAMLMVD